MFNGGSLGPSLRQRSLKAADGGRLAERPYREAVGPIMDITTAQASLVSAGRDL